MTAESEQKALTTLLSGVAISVLSWTAIGAITGAGFLSYIVPKRLSHIDNSQDQAEREDVVTRAAITKLQDAVQDLRDRVIRLESRPP